MKRLIAAAVLACCSNAAFAGGLSGQVIRQGNAPSGNILVPLMLLLVVAAAAVAD